MVDCNSVVQSHKCSNCLLYKWAVTSYYFGFAEHNLLDPHVGSAHFALSENPSSAGTDFRRQIQILTSKIDPRTERIKHL